MLHPLVHLLVLELFIFLSEFELFEAHNSLNDAIVCWRIDKSTLLIGSSSDERLVEDVLSSELLHLPVESFLSLQST